MTNSRHRKQGHGRWLVAAAAALAVLVLVAAMAWADRDGGDGGSSADGADDPVASATALPTGLADPADPLAPTDGVTPVSPSAPGPGGAAVTLESGVTEAARLAAVPLSGSYRSGATLRVQVAGDDGAWSSYPLRIVVDGDGRFATYVELGSLGRNRVRMVDPATGATSNEVVVTVR